MRLRKGAFMRPHRGRRGPLWLAARWSRSREYASSPGNSRSPNRAPAGLRPTTLEQTGLSLTFLADLLGKHLAQVGVLTTSQVVDRMALSGPIIDQLLQFMRAEGRVEVRSRLGLDLELRYG
jgi:hypothetical protein